MIKFLVGFDAAPGQSRAESLRHYRERHGPLVRSVPQFWRHVGGYVQNIALDEGDVARSDLAGVSELWFKGWETYDVAFAEPLYLEHIRPDEQRFADFASLIVVFADEARIFGDAGTPPYKLLRFLARPDGIAADAFRERWQTDHAGAVAADPAVRRLACGYVQNRPLRRAELAFQPSETIDGVDEYWFAAASDLHAFMAAERDHGEAVAACVAQIAAATRVVD